ncbi:MAG: glycosyltransferase WbuB, partial [Acidobacteria bacterium]|nr:glycosyltransferase WbuB [Acidobacteriota bacterium]
SPGYEGLVVPSKFYGIAASGRAALYVGHPEGDVARLIERWDCGMVVPPGDSVRLARVIAELSNNRDRVRKMGQNGRRAWEQNWTRERAVERWHELLRSLNETSG